MTGSVNQSYSTPAAWRASNLLKVPEYWPLAVFSAAGEDHGSAPWSEVDDICELCIKLKEFELCEMMEDTPNIGRCK